MCKQRYIAKCSSNCSHCQLLSGLCRECAPLVLCSGFGNPFSRYVDGSSLLATSTNGTRPWQPKVFCSSTFGTSVYMFVQGCVSILNRLVYRYLKMFVAYCLREVLQASTQHEHQETAAHILVISRQLGNEQIRHVVLMSASLPSPDHQQKQLETCTAIHVMLTSAACLKPFRPHCQLKASRPYWQMLTSLALLKA